MESATATKKTAVKKHQQSEHQELFDLIDNLKINKKYLAELTAINPYTFKMKLAGNNQAYKFTDEEITKIEDALCEISGHLKKYCAKKKK